MYFVDLINILKRIGNVDMYVELVNMTNTQ